MPIASSSSLRLALPKSLLTLGLVSSALAWWLMAPPVMTFSSTAKHAGHFGLVYLHVSGGTLMLFVGLANLYIGTTRKYFKYHRIIGGIYLVGGALGAISATGLTSNLAMRLDAHNAGRVPHTSDGKP